jgi:hypothetical protein
MPYLFEQLRQPEVLGYRSRDRDFQAHDLGKYFNKREIKVEAQDMTGSSVA